nr:hypothetical protein ECPA41_3489 [Escherichia coli PA41]
MTSLLSLFNVVASSNVESLITVIYYKIYAIRKKAKLVILAISSYDFSR